MLVLSRKKGERVMIGRNVEVVVLDMRGSKVQLGIVAPPEVTIHRKEVYDQIQQERQYEAGGSRETELRTLRFPELA